ncbi:MAG: tetratricopeptide repeat protein [Theionarchaea archaeon]|nr:tetratricopeptide repeat protein [Theionarchaea archaeon]
MNVLEIKDLENGKIQVSWKGADTRKCPPIPFSDPLTVEDQEELRWYLEDYLMFPYGAERDHAHTLEEKMERWGESLFSQVFPHCDFYPDPQLLYHEAVREGLDNCELCITSDKIDFLDIPWELLRDPTPGRGYLSPLLGGLYRKRESHKIVAPSGIEGPFRILLVIARPYGERDVPLQTVARPVLEALRPLRKYIELEVLRPPTFDELVERLHRKRGYYNVVHFDGHGVFSESGSKVFGADLGYLVFEGDDGTEYIVSSIELGQELAACRVPLFVLNASQSTQERGENPYSSVASQLIAVGAKGVVAMSYSLYSTAAGKFMQGFYESLIEGKSLAESVAAGRRELHADPYRESVVGKLKLCDWMVPCLYQQEQYTPIPEGTPESEVKDTIYQIARKVCPEGRHGFVGRDYNILEIERRLTDDETPWILISGMGGCGKTALVYGFARWYAETGGCPGGVFVTSFKEKADIAQVIGSIAGFGTDFSQLPQEEQLDLLINYLYENECLLIWDNFETVTGYPEGFESLATKEEQKNLSAFLKKLKGGKTRVLIATRKPDERWLKIGYQLVELKGLNERDSGKLAESILKMVGRNPEDFRDDPHYSRLLTLLRGHPRSLEVVLPHLQDESPAVIIQGLQHRLDELEDVLDASLTYVFHLLSQQTQKHLPVLGLFTSFVHDGIVTLFSQQEEYHYQEVMGELDSKDWKRILEEAASVGLIRSLGSGKYELHPTFPMFLRQKIASTTGKDGLEKLNLEFIKFYGDLAGYLFAEIEKGSEEALFLTAIEEANLLRALYLAETNKEWAIAQAIVQTLYGFYECRGRFNEWNALRNRLFDSIGYEISADADRDKADVWMFLLGEKANSALRRNELEEAESSHQHIIDYLMSLDDPAVEPKIAVGYHNLGVIAQERQQFDQAEKWYRKSLEIRERLGLERDAASDYHNLGVIAQERQQFDQAEKWYRKSLEIYERLGLERDAASDYHQLGRIVQERQQFDQAEKWYRKSLEIYERLGLERDAASDYHNLGIIAQERQQFDQAEKWYRKSLEIYERLGLERYAAVGYHQLGRIAQEKQQFDEAEQWYRRALEIFEELGHPPLLVNTLTALGLLYRQLNLPNESIAWLGKALKIASEYHMRISARILADLAFLLKLLGKEKFVNTWQQIFEEEPPLEIIQQIMEKLEGEPADRVSYLFSLGRSHEQKQNWTEAIEVYRQALALFNFAKTINENQRLYTRIAFRLGVCLMQNGLLTEARELQCENFQLFQLLDDFSGQADVYLEIGHIDQLMNNHEEAWLHYLDAYRLYRRANDKLGMAVAAEALGTLEFYARMLTHAIRDLEDAQELYLSLKLFNKAELVKNTLEMAQRALYESDSAPNEGGSDHEL